MNVRLVTAISAIALIAAACGADVGDIADSVTTTPPATTGPAGATSLLATTITTTLPPETTTPAPTPTPPPTPTDDTLAAPVPTTGRDGCAPATPGVLHKARRTRAGPYFIRHPDESRPDTPIVMFIPGGSTGSERAAERVWANYLSGGGNAVARFRLVIPYAEDFVLIDDTDRILDIVTEVLECHGGDPESFHIAGYSQGGQIAFNLMLRQPELFATVLGAPGEFRINDVDKFREDLAGKAAFNGVGAEDVDWIPSVKATHDALVEAGIESTYVEFPGEGHRLSEEFDESIFFEFWTGH